MQESNLKQFETSFHLRHRQLVFKRPGFLGSVAERGGVEYGFNCSEPECAQSQAGLTQRLWKKKEEEEMSFLGRWVAGTAKAGASENLHEGAACNKQ